MDAKSAEHMARSIVKKKKLNIDWREILSDVWMIMNSGSERFIECYRDLFDIHRIETHIRCKVKVIPNSVIPEIPKQDRPDSSLLKLWIDYKSIRINCKLNQRESLYLYLWLVELWKMREIAQVLGISLALTSKIINEAKEKLGIEEYIRNCEYVHTR